MAYSELILLFIYNLRILHTVEGLVSRSYCNCINYLNSRVVAGRWGSSSLWELDLEQEEVEEE